MAAPRGPRASQGPEAGGDRQGAAEVAAGEHRDCSQK